MWPNPHFPADLVAFTEEMFKGTLMQIEKSVSIFLSIWKYAEDFTLRHLLFFEICARETREKFV